MMRALRLWLFAVGSTTACFSEPEDTCSTDDCSAGASTGDPGSTTGDPPTATSTSPASTTMTSSTPPDGTGDSSGGDGTTTTMPPGDSSSGGDDTAGSTAAELCGDGTLDPDEQCDSGDGCTDCELDNFDCNPLNNAGCPEGSKCAFNDETQMFWCLPFSNDPPGELHEGNCYDFGPHDEWCDVGLACMPAQATGACDDGACCVEFCDRFDASFQCAQAGDDCLPWFGPDARDGLDWLGVCATP